ncbi:MAG: ABC transporter permease [Nitrospinota bacterium]|nr:ABC transporter permease [Nitrospinota bacterium]
MTKMGVGADRAARHGLGETSRMSRAVCMGMIIVQSMWAFRWQQALVLATMAIGSFGLAAIMFLGEGALRNLWMDLDTLMGSRMDVYPAPGLGDKLLQKRPLVHFNIQDLEYVREHAKKASYIAPMFYHRSRISLHDIATVAHVDGIDEPMMKETAYTQYMGSGFTQEGLAGDRMECLLTRSMAERLHAAAEPLPRVAVGAYPCQVVGIIPDPPGADEPLRERVAIPYRWARLLWGGGDDIGAIIVSWRSPEEMEAVVESVRRALDEVRAPGAYQLTSSRFAVRKRKEIVSNIMLAGSAQSLFSILIASIGVLNVMLANVTRRSREFAIRVAVGAEPSDLALIVLMESVALSLIGGLVGLFLAVAGAPLIIQALATRIPEASNITPVITMGGVVAPLAVCVICGALAGAIPAMRARRLDVLAALRAE